MNKTLLESQEGVRYFTSLALSMISTISSVASHSVQNPQTLQRFLSPLYVDLLPVIHLCGAKQHLIAHLGCAILAGSAAPVYVHLCANDEVQRKREVWNQPPWVNHSSLAQWWTAVLRNPRPARRRQSGELTCAARTVVLCDLRELGEKEEQDTAVPSCATASMLTGAIDGLATCAIPASLDWWRQLMFIANRVTLKCIWVGRKHRRENNSAYCEEVGKGVVEDERPACSREVVRHWVRLDERHCWPFCIAVSLIRFFDMAKIWQTCVPLVTARLGVL